MARIRKEPNRYWSKEDKYKIVLNVIDDCITVIIGNEHKHYSYNNIEKEIIYDNKTFKELYNNIKLEEMF